MIMMICLVKLRKRRSCRQILLSSTSNALSLTDFRCTQALNFASRSFAKSSCAEEEDIIYELWAMGYEL